MSGLIGKNNSTLKKSSVRESKLIEKGVKNIKFWHEASAGDVSIPFGSLNLPNDIAAAGLTNPTGTEIISANLAFFKENVEVRSSLNGDLMIGLTYQVQNSQIRFVNGYEAAEGEVFEIKSTNNVVTGNTVVDARPLTATGTLLIGDTEFNVGEAFRTNAYPTEQIGEVMVFLDGEIQFRNVANATAAPGADGNYQEIPAANGFGSIIKFNDTFAVDKAVMVVSRNLIAERPNTSMMQYLETVGGQVDSMIETVANLAGVPESNFTGYPNQIDLKAFGDKLNSILNVDVPSNDIQEYRIYDTTSDLLDRTGEARFDLSTASINNNGDILIEAIDDTANARTKFVAKRKCRVTGTWSTWVGVNNFVASYAKNGSWYQNGGLGKVNEAATVSINIDLEEGEYFSVSVSASSGTPNLAGWIGNVINITGLSFTARDLTTQKIKDLI